VPTAFKGDSLNKSSTLVKTTTHIVVANMGITNLSGIQYFISLHWLNCDSNFLSSLPMLPNSIKYLLCNNNSLINFSALPTSLLQFDCSNNHIYTLCTLPNQLQNLVCRSNYLTNLPILPSSLLFLDCGYNYLTDLPPLPNLINLYCDHNQLNSLPTLPSSLGQLVCENNNIVCFPTFPKYISVLIIYPNPYNCLPNYIAAMGSDTVTYPLCGAGNTNGCAVAGIEQVTGINSQISVYPNPAKDVINVNGLPINEETHIQIIDMFGNFVMEYITSAKATNIDVSVLSEGVYNLSIANKEGVSNKRVVIEK